MPPITIVAAWPLALFAALPLSWLLAWRNRARIGRARLLGATVLRTLVLGAIVAALMRPQLHRASADLSVVYALDVSASVSPRFLGQALDWIAQVEARFHPAQSRFVAFADRALLLDSLAEVRALSLTAGDGAPLRNGPIWQGATDLEQGLSTALSGLAPGHAKRIVLLTDGNQTEGDVWRALPRVRAEGARVFALPAAMAAERDAWVEAISAAPDIRAGAQVDLEARVISSFAAPARIELTIGGHPAAARGVTLSPGENRVKLTARFPRAGAKVVTVRVRAEGDELARNDALSQDIRALPPPHVLYVEGGSPGTRHLADALAAQGIRVLTATPERFSADLRLLADKDAVILSDVRADSLSPQAVQRLQTFVRDGGGGLIFAAGENTYGADGFAGGEVERLLPVKFEARRKRQDLDLVLLLDRSASMRRGKIEVAKSAALATLELLEPDQGLAVVAFDSQPHEVVPLAPVGDKRFAADRIARMTSSGQTDIYSALEHAQMLLSRSQAELKHIILLSDGLTAPPPSMRGTKLRFLRGDSPWPAAEGPLAAGFKDLMTALSTARITLSSVILGEGPDVKLMTTLAKWGHGKTYQAQTDEEVPSLFVGETRRVRGDAVVEFPFRPTVKAASPTLDGVNFATAPALRGFVESRSKRFSEVLLEARPDLPLLAQTHYGLGKTVVFLSDVKNRWAADWLTWPGYARLWAQVVRDSARRASVPRLDLRVTREGDSAHVDLTALAADESFRDGLEPKVRVITPDGEGSTVALRQTAPGRYGARLPLGAPASAPWRFELQRGPGMAVGEIARTGTRSLFHAYPDEYRLLPPNLPLLRALTAQTGGALAPDADEIFRPRDDGGMRIDALWPLCVALALVLFVFDVAVRRMPWRPSSKPRS